MRPDLVDAHVYGGALLVAAGFACWVPWLGPIILGTILLTLGIVRL